jgi:hypothetical protein
MTDDEYTTVVARTLGTYMDNPELTIPYREAGKAWADEQTVKNKADEWEALLKSVVKDDSRPPFKI